METDGDAYAAKDSEDDGYGNDAPVREREEDYAGEREGMNQYDVEESSAAALFMAPPGQVPGLCCFDVHKGGTRIAQKNLDDSGKQS